MSSSKTVLSDEASVQREADLKLLLKRNIDKNLVIGQVVKEDILDKLWDELSRREFREMFEAVAVVFSSHRGASHRVRAGNGKVPHILRFHGQEVRAQQEPVDRKRKRRRRGSID